MKRLAVLLAIPLICSALTGCECLKLFRPSVLKQLHPDVVRLLNELLNVHHPNEDVIGRLFAHGGLSEADDNSDGSGWLNGFALNRIGAPRGDALVVFTFH